MDNGMRGWLKVKVDEGHRFENWIVLQNGLLLIYSDSSKEFPQEVYPLLRANLSFPTTSQLILRWHGLGSQLQLSGESALLLVWHSALSAHIKQCRAKLRLSILFRNRMRFDNSCKLCTVNEDFVGHSYSSGYVKNKERECESWAMGRVENVHRLRELSLMPEEDRPCWASLPEVEAAKCGEEMSEELCQSYEQLFGLVISEVVFNQEMGRLVDLARASVRWKDPLPLFNRRSIIGCSLRVKKCSDWLVRRLEDEWPHSLVSDPGRIFGLLEASFTAATAQTYIAYCDNLDDTRTLFRRATQRDSVAMGNVISARCHIECALLPIQRLCQLRASLDRVRQFLLADDCNQLLMQCQQLHVTVSGIVELCFKVLSSLHGGSYVADIENMLDFSSKLSTLRVRRHKSLGRADSEGAPLSRLDVTQVAPDREESNVYSGTPVMDRRLSGSFNLIDLRSMENLLVETPVDSVSSGSNSGSEYELIELKNMAASRPGDTHLLQKSFDEQPLYQQYDQAGKALSEIDSQTQSKSIFYAYLDLMENVYEDINECVKSSPIKPLRTLWCETDEVVASGTLDSLTPSQIALQESKFEILTSEVSYLKSLNILITLFVESTELKDVLDCEDRQRLFGNILEVRKASEIFLFDLAGHWEEDLMLPDVCSVVLKHTQATFRVYIEYCSNQLRFHRTLQRLMLDRDRFMRVLGVLEGLTACQGYSLQSFLMLPVQRVTRLPLLIQAVQRRVPAGTTEADNCTVAFAAVNQLVHECNECVRTYEQDEQIQALTQILQTDTKEKVENKINSETSCKIKKEKNNRARRQSSIFRKIF